MLHGFARERLKKVSKGGLEICFVTRLTSSGTELYHWPDSTDLHFLLSSGSAKKVEEQRHNPRNFLLSLHLSALFLPISRHTHTHLYSSYTRPNGEETSQRRR